MTDGGDTGTWSGVSGSESMAAVAAPTVHYSASSVRNSKYYTRAAGAKLRAFAKQKVTFKTEKTHRCAKPEIRLLTEFI